MKKSILVPYLDPELLRELVELELLLVSLLLGGLDRRLRPLLFGDADAAILFCRLLLYFSLSNEIRYNIAWLPDCFSEIFRLYVFGPSGFWTMPLLRCIAKFDPFLALDCARVEGGG